MPIELENQLEKIQLNAARIVTGATISCHRADLYRETGWDSLSKRRLMKRLTMMYKMVNNMAPEYLCSLILNPPSDNTNVTLRNRHNLKELFARTELYRTSFLVSTIKEWNRLELSIREAPTINSFRYRLKKELCAKHPPKYYNTGHRKLNVIHCQMRNNCSPLNAHLYST